MYFKVRFKIQVHQ